MSTSTATLSERLGSGVDLNMVTGVRYPVTYDANDIQS
jgi:hypothetical protein